MKRKDIIIDLHDIGIDYCNLLISFLIDNNKDIKQEDINNINTTIFYDVMAQICSILDMSEINGEIKDFYDKVNDIPDFKSLQYYEFLVDRETNLFFCDISKALAYKVYSLVNNYVDLTSLSIRTYINKTTLRTLIISIEKTGPDTFQDIIF